MNIEMELEFAKFLGRWRQIESNSNCVVNPVEEYGENLEVEFSGDSFIVFNAKGERVIEGVFCIDLSAIPKRIDWLDTLGSDAGKILPSIYEICDDHLIFSAADADMNRPQSYEPQMGHTIRRFVKITEAIKNV